MIKENLIKTLNELFTRLGIKENPETYLNELEGDSEFMLSIESKIKDVPEFKTKHFESVYHLGRAYKIIQYVMIRVKKPGLCIETGVLHGLSTSFILNAIAKNKKGILISIDKPAHQEWKDRAVSETGQVDSDNLPQSADPGWAIPDFLRKNWKLELGISSDLLPIIFENEQCDYFVHDSEHTYKNMMFELESAWQNINPKGIIV